MDSNDDLLGYIKASKNRQKVLKALYNNKITPVETSKKTKILFTNISKILRDLTEKELVQCTTPGLRKGKLFTLTQKGCTVYEELKS